MPEGCLRKEDSKPKVYLIDNGTKPWVTLPAVLFALGKSWADVRSVPDGALSNVPADRKSWCSAPRCRRIRCQSTGR
jgi:hypothetical protein